MSDVLSEAQSILKDRQDQYGDPEKQWGAIAVCWTEWLTVRGVMVEGARLDASDAIALMEILKIMRLANGYHRDSVVDMINYAVIYDKCS